MPVGTTEKLPTSKYETTETLPPTSKEGPAAPTSKEGPAAPTSKEGPAVPTLLVPSDGGDCNGKEGEQGRVNYCLRASPTTGYLSYLPLKKILL